MGLTSEEWCRVAEVGGWKGTRLLGEQERFLSGLGGKKGGQGRGVGVDRLVDPVFINKT